VVGAAPWSATDWTGAALIPFEEKRCHPQIDYFIHRQAPASTSTDKGLHWSD